MGGQITKTSMGLVKQIINADRYITACYKIHLVLIYINLLLRCGQVNAVLQLSFLGLELIFEAFIMAFSVMKSRST